MTLARVRGDALLVAFLPQELRCVKSTGCPRLAPTMPSPIRYYPLRLSTLLVATGVEDVQPSAFSDEHGLTITERAPFGVIGPITPATNPLAMITSNSIGMMAAGNSVVFNVHPNAKRIFRRWRGS